MTIKRQNKDNVSSGYETQFIFVKTGPPSGLFGKFILHSPRKVK